MKATPAGFISAVLSALVYGYIFTCLHSLYEKIRGEKISTVNFQRP
jgi:hypothetical protein